MFKVEAYGLSLIPVICYGPRLSFFDNFRKKVLISRTAVKAWQQEGTVRMLRNIRLRGFYPRRLYLLF